MKKLIPSFFILMLLLGPAFAASSRSLPTSYVESTYCASGCDYSSLAAWEAATDVDLSTDKGYVLTVQPGTYNDTVLIQGATSTTNEQFRIIRGSDPANKPIFNITNDYSSEASLFYLYENYAGLYDVEIEYSGTATADVYGARLRETSPKIVGVIVHDIIPSSGYGRGIAMTTPGIIINCIVYNCQRVNITTYSDIKNCTSYGGVTYGISLASGVTAINCISEGSDTDWYLFGGNTRTTCTDGSGVQFVDAAGGDFRLSASDTAAKGQGTDLSATFDDDFAGSTRTAPWDIGAWMYTPTGLPAWKRAPIFW